MNAPLWPLVMAAALGVLASQTQGQTLESSAADSPVAQAALEIGSSARPEWVERLPFNDRGTHCIPVASEPFVTIGECENRLDELLVLRTAEYVDNFLGYDGGARRLGLTAARIRERYLSAPDRFEEELGLSFGSMSQVHVLVKFDAAAQADLRQQWRSAQQVNRLAYFGVCVTAVLVGLGGLLGLVRARRIPRGVQSRLLPWATLATIVGVAAAVGCGYLCLPRF